MRIGSLGEHPVLPFQGSTSVSRHCSYQGAKAAMPRAGSQAWKVYFAIKDRPMTMHELAAAVDLPLATICARVGWLRQRELVRAIDTRKNPTTHVSNTVWGIV